MMIRIYSRYFLIRCPCLVVEYFCSFLLHLLAPKNEKNRSTRLLGRANTGTKSKQAMHGHMFILLNNQIIVSEFFRVVGIGRRIITYIDTK